MRSVLPAIDRKASIFEYNARLNVRKAYLLTRSMVMRVLRVLCTTRLRYKGRTKYHCEEYVLGWIKGAVL